MSMGLKAENLLLGYQALGIPTSFFAWFFGVLALIVLMPIVIIALVEWSKVDIKGKKY